MREHHALGLSRGAGGVDEGGEVVGFDGSDQGVEIRDHDKGQHRRHRQGSWKRDGAFRSVAIHDEDALELGLGTNGVELFELLAGRDDGDAASGVGEEDGDLIAGQRGIDGDIDGVDGEDGEVGDGPFPAIFGRSGRCGRPFWHPSSKRPQRASGRAGRSDRRRGAASCRTRPARGWHGDWRPTRRGRKRSLIVESGAGVMSGLLVFREGSD